MLSLMFFCGVQVITSGRPFLQLYRLLPTPVCRLVATAYASAVAAAPTALPKAPPHVDVQLLMQMASSG